MTRTFVVRPLVEYGTLVYVPAQDEWTFSGPDGRALPQGKEIQIVLILNALAKDGWRVVTHARQEGSAVADLIILEREFGEATAAPGG